MNLINVLKKSGYRVTTSREIICRILEEAGHEHFTADSLFNLARKHSNEIDLATIYRTFELLEELGIIEHDSEQSQGQNNNEDISSKTISKVNELISKDTNYEIEKNHFVYSGFCKKCK